MRYFGGKSKTAESIAAILNSRIQDGVDYYLEPFCGACWVSVRVTHPLKMLCDRNSALISMWECLRDGWIPPEHVSEEEYRQAKYLQDSNPLKAFIGFGCSFAGKWFGGYCRDAKGCNYAMRAKNSCLSKIKHLSNSNFLCIDYRDLTPVNALIYCDPPYAGTTPYNAIGAFDSSTFWDRMRFWSKKNIVIISEYSSPKDFQEIAAFPTKTGIRNKKGAVEQRIERLFQYKGNGYEI